MNTESQVNYVIVLTPEQRLMAKTVILEAMFAAAAEVCKLDATQHPDKYPRAVAMMELLSEILAEFNSAEEVGAQPAPLSPRQTHSPDEIAAMEAVGLDPEKELGPYDPRASNPRCVHGRFFTEDCPDCVIVEQLTQPPPA